MTKNFISANPRPRDLNESNDCTVRATSLAMNLPYEKVHKAYADVGRKRGKGVNALTINAALRKITGNDERMVRVMGKEPTFAQFARENNKGKYIVVKRGHAVALIDGVWHDAHVSQVGARNRVIFYYQIKG